MWDNDNYILTSRNSRLDPPKAYMRFLHAAPDTPSVDVYINDKLIAQTLFYRDFTTYLKIGPGNINIRVFLSGRKINPLVNTNIFIPQDTIYTISITGMLGKTNIIKLPEPLKMVPQGKALIRYANLSFKTPNVDLILDNGKILFSNVSSKEFTDYMQIDGGTYNFRIVSVDTSELILAVPNINIKVGNIYTIYSVGIKTGNPSIQVLIPLDGNTYLKF